MDYKLQDLIDISLFQAMLDSLNEIYTFPSAILDLQGNILAATAWQDLCVKFHRVHPQSEKECKLSDQYISDHLHEANPTLSYRCPHGMIDCATPVIINGKHLGTLFIGQIFLEKPDIEFFKKQASLHDFDELSYLQAVEKVPVWTQGQLDKYLAVIRNMIGVLVGIGSKKLQEIEMQKIIRESEERFKNLFNSAPDAIILADTETGIVIDANYAASKLIRKPVAEIIGMHHLKLHPERTEQHTKETFQDHAERGKEIGEIPAIENMVIRPDGTEIPVEIVASTLTIDGKSIIHGVFRNITRRKQIEAELSASEKKYRVLAENLPDIICRFDTDLRYTYVNPGFEKISELPATVFLGKTNEDLQMPAENVLSWNKNLRWVFENEKLGTFETTFNTSNSVMFFSTLLVPEFDQEGKISSVLSVSRDITNQKKSENNLRIQHDISIMLGEANNLNQALNRLLEMVCQLEGIDCGRIYQVDQSSGNFDMVAHYGFSEQYIIQNSQFHAGLVNASIIKSGNPVFRSYSEILAHNNPVIIQEKLHSISIIPIIYNGIAIASFNLASHHFDQIPEDSRIAIESIASNLGGTILRISTENKLKDSENKYKLAFRTSPDSININTIDGSYVDVNEGFTALTGYSKKEILGISILDMNLWAIPADQEKLIARLKKKGKVENLETVFRTKDGSLKTGLLSASLISINNMPHIISITRDITERKKMITELIASKEKAEESDRLKTSFLANMSHELRTPMNGILGFTELLDDPSLSNEERREYLSVISDSSQSLLNVITNIMDISKIDSRQLNPKIRSFNLNGLLDEVLNGFKSEKIIRDKSHLILELQKGLSSEKSLISSDPAKIRHILILLLNNAAKFTNEGFIHFGYSLSGQNIRFFVKDSGIGIASDKLNSVFERFRQEDETLSRKYGGVGLGLSIAKGIVELMNGQISVESEPGKGSTFWFEIPMN